MNFRRKMLLTLGRFHYISSTPLALTMPHFIPSQVLLAHGFDASLRVSITSITLLDSFWSKNKVKTCNIDKVVLITVFRRPDDRTKNLLQLLDSTAHFYFVHTQIICQTFQVPLSLLLSYHSWTISPFLYSLFLHLIPFHFIYHPPLSTLSSSQTYSRHVTYKHTYFHFLPHYTHSFFSHFRFLSICITYPPRLQTTFFSSIAHCFYFSFHFLYQPFAIFTCISFTNHMIIINMPL